MFEKLKKYLKQRRKRKHNYDLTFDNVAIPEVHVKSTESHEDTDKENAPISYDNVAIPEVHIRNRKINKLKLHMPFALSQSSYPSLLIVLILPSQQILSFPQTDPPLK